MLDFFTFDEPPSSEISWALQFPFFGIRATLSALATVPLGVFVEFCRPGSTDPKAFLIWQGFGELRMRHTLIIALHSA